MNPFNDEYFMKQALVEARAAASEGEVPAAAGAEPGASEGGDAHEAC